jgi:hypothetical protein
MLQKIALSGICAVRASTARDIFRSNSFIAASPLNKFQKKVRSGAFPGDRMPIGGSALQASESPRRTLCAATAMPESGDENLTPRMLMESALFSNRKEK